jgi:DnaJ-domain-containing protein 1
MLRDENAKQKILVEIMRQDGRSMVGYLIVPQASDLRRFLNNNAQFVEFEDLDGVHQMIAKQSMVDVSAKSLAGSPDIKVPNAQDPYMILGLTKTAGSAEVRAAYLKLTKLYHPDQFNSVRLPDEVVRYLAAMFDRSNTAYNLIKSRSQSEMA